MRIFITTKVESSLENVHSKFNRELFEKLSPPFVDITVDRFDGCLKGDQIHLTMNILGLKQSKWISTITTSEFNSKEFYFIDEGQVLPYPLMSWKHVHRVEKINEQCCYVIDNIEFKTKSALLDKLIYPTLYSLFLYRVPIYKKELGI